MPLSAYIEDPTELEGLTPQFVLPAEINHDFASVAIEQDEQPTPHEIAENVECRAHRRKSPYRLRITAEGIAADVKRAREEESEARVALLFRKAEQLSDNELEHRSAGSEITFDAAWNLDSASCVNPVIAEFRADRFLLARRALGANSMLFHLFVFLYQDGQRYRIAPGVLNASPLVQEIRRTVGRMYRKHQLHVLRYLNTVRRHHSEVGKSQVTKQKSRKHTDSVRLWLCPEEAEKRNHA
jgi:hypothetical protein